MDSSLWICRTLVLIFYWTLRYTSAFPQGVRNRNPDRRVIFPDTNSTGTRHSLPVFPEHIAYVGESPPVAPPVDKFGHPLCAKQFEDTFCEGVDNYPEETIRQAIKYSKDEFKELFGTMSINPRKVAPGDLSEDTICKQESRLFFPKAAMNENDQWAYVINDVDYVQAVRSEMCEKEGKPCRYLDGALPSGVSSRCKQKYAYKKMLALHPDQRKTYSDAFRFPSCCVCYVTRPYVLSRTQLSKVLDDDSSEP